MPEYKPPQWYAVTVQYDVKADSIEDAIAKVRAQLYRDDEHGHTHDEDRVDFLVRDARVVDRAKEW